MSNENRPDESGELKAPACKDCVFWKETKEPEWREKPLGYRVGECEAADNISHGGQPEINGMGVWSLDDYSLGLSTGENFYCSIFQANESKDGELDTSGNA